MNSATVKRVIAIVSGALAAFGLFQFWTGYSSAEAYNGYVKQMQVLLEQQDTILDEIEASTDAEGAKKVDGWLSRSKEIEEAMQKVAIEKDWLRGLHDHMMKRGRSVSEMVAAEKRYFETGDKAALDKMSAHATEAGAHLEAFLKERDRLAKEKNFELKE